MRVRPRLFPREAFEAGEEEVDSLQRVYRGTQGACG
jgi:hypothetical protein